MQKAKLQSSADSYMIGLKTCTDKLEDVDIWLLSIDNLAKVMVNELQDSFSRKSKEVCEHF